MYLDLQQIEKSEEWFKRTLTLDPNYRSALYNLGLLLNHLQRYEEAVEVLTKFVSLSPDHANGAQVLGDCYMRLSQRAKAEEMYELVLRHHPNHTIALHNLGKTLFVSLTLSKTLFITACMRTEMETLHTQFVCCTPLPPQVWRKRKLAISRKRFSSSRKLFNSIPHMKLQKSTWNKRNFSSDPQLPPTELMTPRGSPFH